MGTQKPILDALKNQPSPFAKRLAALLEDLDSPLSSLTLTNQNYQDDDKSDTLEEQFAKFIITQLVDSFTNLDLIGDYSKFVTKLETMSLYFLDEDNNPADKTQIAPAIYALLLFPNASNAALNSIAKQIANHEPDTSLDNLINNQLARNLHDPDALVALLISSNDEEKDDNADEDDDDEVIATISGGPAVPRKTAASSSASGGRPSTSSPSKARPSPTPPPATPLTADHEKTITDFVKHYTTWAHLAANSIYESTRNKAHLTDMTNRLTQMISAISHPNQANLLAELKTATSDLSRPQTEIAHYGKQATLKNITYAANASTPIINPSDVRTTTLELGGGVEVEIKEQYRAAAGAAGGGSTFISQTILPDTLADDQLKTWARAAITSFLAAAPSNANTPHFEDGLREQELAALISYCNFMGYPYTVGPMQIMRTFAAELRITTPNPLSAAQWDQLAKNEVINGLDPQVCANLAAKIPDVQRNQWLGKQANFTDGAWKTFIQAHPDNRIPSLGKAELSSLTQNMQTLATTQHLTPTATPQPQTNTSSPHHPPPRHSSAASSSLFAHPKSFATLGEDDDPGAGPPSPTN